ncbi:ABC transporter ATP-binding protein [Salinicoccus albus]|uniref:ABC transporter ATP-binding protein n=1 Tax=Salinicoccus albus TaxID=418756 RepID=UPI00036D372F|nr:sn-glycerol-3-phosphate ABC transporter ATP-binding protein UgpC [Salinicoccus albus]
MAEMKLENVKKIFDETPVIHEFNLEIQDGEFIVLVGPSGSGKSTMLRMIAGLEAVSAGSIYINGQRMDEVLPKHRDIAMVFQNYALYPHMSVFDNMAFGLKLRKTLKDEIKTRVENAAEILNLTDYLNRKPEILSGGQKQRVALGRAIVREANVFLMDEPLSNLDAKLRVQMRAEIIRLHKRLSTTTVYVTHDQTEALTMASRLVVLDKGEIMQTGSPKAVYDFPKNVFVAKFIGAPAMNIFEAEIENGRLIIGKLVMDLPEYQRHKLTEDGYEGRKIKFGIRPEHIKEVSVFSGLDDVCVFTAEVRVSELLGAEVLLYSELNGQEFIFKAGGDKDVKPGDDVKLAFDISKGHFFNPVNDERIVVLEQTQSEAKTLK